MQYGDDMYQERVYREQISSENLYRKTVILEETDLLIVTSNPFERTSKIEALRKEVSSYIHRRPEFEDLVPISQDAFASEMIKHMIQASKEAGVGPMATVAGAISHYVGESLMDSEIMIENGGDSIKQ